MKYLLNLFTHKNTLILFGFLFFLLFIFEMLYRVPFFLYISLLLIFLVLETLGAFFISLGFHLNAICSFPSKQKSIVLTFDDGPNPEYTEKVLKVLEKFQCKATFFVIGKNILGNEDILKKISDQGHLIGNHSYSHSFFFDVWDWKKVQEDLKLCNLEIKKILGKEPTIFRPPFGVTNPNIAKACRELSFHVIGWNLRSLDTVLVDKNRIIKRVKSRIQPGSILLFHDKVKDIDIVLESILEYLTEKKYEIVGLNTIIG